MDQLIILDTLKKVVLRCCHTFKTTGYFGVAKSFPRLRENFYWAMCQPDVENLAENDVCNTKKVPLTADEWLVNTSMKHITC